ncbi:hypothetical protein GCM10007426_05210 [Alloalcanivorax dieselolei]|nr:hypothetical protein GCM10007426_05210 [Alloalcanivorax dieselolei]
MHWPGIQMRNGLLPSQYHGQSKLLGQHLVDRGAIASDDVARRKSNVRDLVMVARLEPKKPFYFSKAPGALATSKFLLAIPDSKQTITFNTTRLHSKRLAPLAQHRLDGIAPQFADCSYRCHRHLHGIPCCVNEDWVSPFSWRDLLMTDE